MNNESAATPGVRVAAAAQPRRRWRWLLYALAALVLLLAGALAFARYALPGIVRDQAERIVFETLHRKLHIAQVEVHPLTLEFALQGVQLMEADAKTVFVSFERFDARLSWASLTQLAPVVREVHLAAPYVHFVREAPGKYSTDDIVAALDEAARKKPPAAPAAAPPKFAVHNIRVEGGRLEFDDRPKQAQHTVADLALGVPFVSTFPAQEEIFVEPLLKAVIDGAALNIQGKTLPFAPTPEANVDLNLDDIDLLRFVEYLPPDLPGHLASGHLALHLHLVAQLPKGQTPRLAASGTVALHGVEAGLKQVSQPLKFAALELAIAAAEFPAGKLEATLTVNGKGRVGVAGEFAATPLKADLALNLDDFDLLPLQPLFADRVNLRVTRAALVGKGRVQLAQEEGKPLLAQLQGDYALPRLATIDAVNANDFVAWDTLAVQGLHFVLQPLSLHIDRVTLDKLTARVILNANGRFNLQDVAKAQVEEKRSITEATPVPPVAGAADATTPAAPAPSRSAGPPLPPISIGQVALRDGRVRYSDNFIKPRYSADLQDLHGTVSGLSSQAGSAATVDLHGKVNDAPLLIAGTVNPLLREPSLKIQGSVHDMELAGFSPYSGKYVGYRIERGKLSFEADYELENRQLKATNHLVLDQLTFGDKVESVSATSLPVTLAIALLKDRNGVIDINLPIAGSLDDPQFSVGGLIVRVLVNLITKAVTAPFALLGSLFGGGEELSSIEFAPGQAVLAPAAQARLKSLATALQERPGLKLDISGRADPLADRTALQAAKLDALLRGLKRKDLAARGTLVSSAEVQVTPDEYPALLARAYKAEVAVNPVMPAPAAAPVAAGDGTPKPAPAPGAASTPSQPAMEDLLRARQAVADEDLLALGNQRAAAAKDWLKGEGQVAEDRLALVAAKIGEAKDGAPPAHAGSVQFDLH
jgi:uncharacterized protein involved in outer membrane biogenesis